MTAFASAPYRSPVPASSTPSTSVRSVVDGHAQPELAPCGVAEQEQPCAAGLAPRILSTAPIREATRLSGSAMSSG